MTILMIILAFILGLAVMTGIVIYGMRRYMIIRHESNYDFDTTVEKLKQAVEAADGWVFPIPEWHFSDVMIKHNKPFASVDKLQVFFICKADYAKRMIDKRPEMASLMPCGLAVFLQNGKTYIGSMNIPLMSMMFGGVEKEIFRAVGREEADMLHKTLD